MENPVMREGVLEHRSPFPKSGLRTQHTLSLPLAPTPAVDKWRCGFYIVTVEGGKTETGCVIAVISGFFGGSFIVLCGCFGFVKKNDCICFMMFLFFKKLDPAFPEPSSSSSSNFPWEHLFSSAQVTQHLI